MKTLYWLPLAALAAFAADCGDITDPVDSDLDTDTEFAGDFLIGSVTLACDTGADAAAKTDDVITLDVMFEGWAEIVEMDIIETGDSAFPDNLAAVYQEYHILPADANTTFAADGSSDTWQYEMSNPGTLVGGTGNDEDNRASGSTFFDCSDDNRLEMDGSLFTSVAIKVAATPDNSARDTTCAIFGHRSEEAYSGDGCECFEAFLPIPPANPCGAN
jgi:hypothetical protein